jgi:hypothetical protein
VTPADRIAALTDAQLLAATDTAVKVALAIRVLHGHVTVEEVMRATGYAKSTVYRCRTELLAIATAHEHTDQLALELPLERLPVVPDKPGLPVWQAALAERMPALEGRRSFDVYRDLFAPAFDQCKLASVGDCIAITVAFVEYLDGEPLGTDDRALVAKLVRRFGKAAMYGLAQALGVTREDDGKDRYRYARQVAQRTVEEITAKVHEKENAPA